MPPKTRFTEEVILNAAFELTRADGIDAVTARSLASRLSCSTAPIFSRFESMDALHEALMDRIIREFVAGVTAEEGDDAIVAAGVGWLQFATSEPCLYEAVFLRRHPWHSKWGRIRREMADRMAEDVRYKDWDRNALFALVGRVSIVMHGLGVELWSGRLPSANLPGLVEQFVLPVIDAAHRNGWRDDLHSAAPD
ncbi:MAG: AcrR family transcriptional regulator [Bradymonadia bacterium]|jgi:AcrR family transcriptional regulator